MVCSERPIVSRTYGDCNQIIYNADQVVVQELHCFRGLGFFDKGCKHFASLDGALAEEAIYFRTLAPQEIQSGRHRSYVTHFEQYVH